MKAEVVSSSRLTEFHSDHGGLEITEILRAAFGIRWCLKFPLTAPPCSKVPGCSGARPVKSLGNSELPLKNLCENCC